MKLPRIPFLDKLLGRDKQAEGLEIRPEDIEIEDIIAPSLIEIRQNHIKLGERLAKSFFVFSYPRYLSAGWLSPAINLNYPIDISLHIHPIDTGATLKRLRKKLTEIQAELAEREEKGLIRDPALETAYKDIERLRDELQTARERVFRLGLYLTAYGDDEKELRQVENVLRSIFEARLIYVKPTLMREKQGFVSTAPYGLDEIMVHTPMNTAPLSSIFPFVSPDLSANEGVLYGINRHNNSLVLFDRFSLENSNLVVFSKSGSGKSLDKNAEVLCCVKDEIQLRKIGPLVDEIIEEQGIDFRDEELEGKTLPGLSVWTFDENMKGRWGEVSIAARKEAPKIFYKFKTRSGREITTTGDHNLVALKNGKVDVVRGDEVKKGEFIPLPRTISFSRLKKPERFLGFEIGSRNFLTLVGLITAEGSVQGDTVVSISNIDREVLNTIQHCLTKLNVHYVPQYRGGRMEGIIAKDKKFVAAITRLGGGGTSGEKQVCPFIFGLDRKRVAQYLSAYFEGDGGVEKDRFMVTASSKSKQLISEITYLLYYFGIVARIHKTKKKPTNCDWKRKKTYWVLSITGQDNLRKFAKEINFISERKKKLLAGIIQKTGNTNVDFVPGVADIFREIYDLLPSQLHRIQDISNLKRKHYQPSQQKLKEMIGVIEERIQGFKDMASTFDVLTQLPSLAEIIELGWTDKKLNAELWKTLGASWPLMRSQKVQPRSKNVFKAAQTIYGRDYCFDEIKQVLHFGFKEMDLGFNSYSRSLQSALTTRPKSNTRYAMIQQAAQYVWQNYQEILTNKIPQVEAKLQQLKMLANAELFWDPIVEVKKIENKKDKYVYDLTCENGVFLAGKGGMFVHNSYFCKLEILRYLMQNVLVLVVDPENEYEHLSDAVGGAFFKISLNSPHHLNPFELNLPEEEARAEDVLRGNIINLVGLLRIMLGGLSAEEDAIIDQALTATYAVKGITTESDPATWKGNMPLMSDFEEVLTKMKGAESLVRRVRKFTKGTFSQFFNSPSNVVLDKKLVVFGIRDMEDELRPMAMFIILRYIWNQVRSSLKKRILLVDEAWWIMQSEDGASFLYGICKRARKYWLGVSTITQDVTDFMSSNYGRPIITNSSLQFLMKQSPAAIDLVQQTFGLTDGEKNTLLESDVGEGIFIGGQKRVVLKVIASYAEDQIITSSPEQVKKIKEEKKRISQLPQLGSDISGQSAKPEQRLQG